MHAYKHRETRTDVSTERIAALERMVGNLIEQNKMIVGSLEDLKKKESAPLTYASRVAADTGAVSRGGSTSFGAAQNGVSGQDRGRHLNVDRLQTRTRSQTPKRPRLDNDHEQQHGGQPEHRFSKAGLDKLASHTARYALHEIASL